ncbi:glycosyltransferase family 39 protein [bacterium]|nr:glycosyltransferase family 39 protein [bacterium]
MRRVLRIVFFLYLGAYGIVLYFSTVPVLSGPDQLGYFLPARTIQLYNRFNVVPENQLSFMAQHLVETEKGLFYSKHPPLFPLILGLTMKVVGLKAAFYLNPLFSLLTLLGLYWLLMTWVKRETSYCGVVLLSLLPMFYTMATDQWAHPSGLFFLTYAFLFYRWGQSSVRNTRKSLAFYCGAGLFLGIASGIRYTDSLLILPCIIAFFFERPTTKLLSCGSFLCGLFIPISFVLYYHATVYGHPFLTGYSLVEEQTAFSGHNFFHNCPLYVKTLLKSGLGPLLFSTLIGLFFLFWTKPRQALYFSVWIFPLFILYSAYYWLPLNPESLMRFLIPIFIPAIIVTLMLIEYLVFIMPVLSSRLKGTIVLIFLGFQVIWGGYNSFRLQEKSRGYATALHHSLLSIQKQIPSQAVIFAQVGQLRTLSLFPGYTLYTSTLFTKKNMQRELLAVVNNANITTIQKKRIASLYKTLFQDGTKDYNDHVTDVLCQGFSSGKPVYIIAPAQQLEHIRSQYQNTLLFQQLPPPSQDPLCNATGKSLPHSGSVPVKNTNGIINNLLDSKIAMISLRDNSHCTHLRR